jgi:hypothetical protein
VSEPSELELALAALEGRAPSFLGDGMKIAEGARLLRAMAADFAEYAHHGLDERARTCRHVAPGATIRKKPCTCGLDAARARWRVKP